MLRAAAQLAWIIFCAVAAAPAWAQYEVEQEERVWLRALLDLRLVRAGPALSWTDSGPGRMRYGGRVEDGGTERETRVALSQLAFEVGTTLPAQIRAHAQINFEPDVADGIEPWLVEAILRREWGDGGSGWGLQGGVMGLPFSLEHWGPSWTPARTLSASALNSWMWEEASLAGLEGEWWHETRGGFHVGALLGAGFGPDRIARLLALRGWAIGDVASGINTDLALPGQDERMRIFHERDDRPAVYARLAFSDSDRHVSLQVGHFDNLGDQSVSGVWHTKFDTVGITLRPHARVEVLAQYLDGDARVAAPDNDSALRAWYAQASYEQGRYSIAARYESFQIRDLDGGVDTTDDGDAVTLCWQWQWALRHRLAFEHIWLDSNRPASGPANPTPDGWQLSYRFRY